MDESARKTETREALEEALFPNVPEVWHENLVRVGTKGNATTKEIITNVENFEECERKFQ